MSSASYARPSQYLAHASIILRRCSTSGSRRYERETLLPTRCDSDSSASSRGCPFWAQFHAILGYHLDTACRCHEKLSEPASAYGELATRAGAALATAGQLAWRRWEDSARALLSRALELLPTGHELRARALLSLAFAELYSAGAGGRMMELVDLGLDETARNGDDVMRLRFELARVESRVWQGEDDAIDWRRQQAENAIVVFERVGEIDGIVQALGLISLTEQDAMQGERAAAEGNPRFVLHHPQSLARFGDLVHLVPDVLDFLRRVVGDIAT